MDEPAAPPVEDAKLELVGTSPRAHQRQLTGAAKHLWCYLGGFDEQVRARGAKVEVYERRFAQYDGFASSQRTARDSGRGVWDQRGGDVHRNDV